MPCWHTRFDFVRLPFQHVAHILSLKLDTLTPFYSGIDPPQIDRPLLIHSCSNSTWITEYPPCITYGLRGVVHATVEVCSQGLSPSSFRMSRRLPAALRINTLVLKEEPRQNQCLTCMCDIRQHSISLTFISRIRLLATLTDGQHKVAISGFCVLSDLHDGCISDGSNRDLR